MDKQKRELLVDKNSLFVGGGRGICKERQRRNSEPAERHRLLLITTCNKLASTPKRRKEKVSELRVRFLAENLQLYKSASIAFVQTTTVCAKPKPL